MGAWIEIVGAVSVPAIVRLVPSASAKPEALKLPIVASWLAPINCVAPTELPVRVPTTSDPVPVMPPFVAVSDSRGACCVPGIVSTGARIVSAEPAATLPSARADRSVSENAPAAEPLALLNTFLPLVSVTDPPLATMLLTMICPPGWVIAPVASSRNVVAMPVRLATPSMVTEAADADGVVAPISTLVKPPRSSVPPLV